MSVTAVIPIKPFAEAKSRLSDALAGDQRAALSRKMYCHVLRTALACDPIAHVIVISRDADALAIARTEGAEPLQETGVGELNAALDQARQRVTGSLLVLPGDLAELGGEDLTTLLEGARTPAQSVVIAPDRAGSGTNALLLTPPDIILFQFGPDSFDLHCEAARIAGIEPVIVKRPGLACDIDRPEDLN
jgi:2-phospho-L-lactate guanylyltransferase